MARILSAGSMVMMLLCGMTALAQEKTPRPNIVLINIDDLGYADIGPFGSTANATPHLDRMAAEGCKVMSHYAHPVCSPSRAALMTGCYPKRVLQIPSVLFPVAAVGLNPSEITLAELLKQAGYATACVGKWHLGDQPEFLPTRQGFDEYLGLPYSNDMGPIADGARSTLGKIEPAQLANKNPPNIDEFGVRGNGQPPLPLIENETAIERVTAAEQFTLVKRYTERAQRFIQAHRDGPFFLYLPHNAVHFPLYPSESFQGKSNGKTLGDWVQEVDWSVGQIMQTLRELNLDRQTLVIFTSDNGGPLKFGANNQPLRGGKGQTLEGGVRVPFLVWWPGQIPAGRTTAEITTMMDLLPTLVTLAGGKVSTDRKIDGVNVWSTWVGGKDKPARDNFYYFHGARLEAVRQGPWKLHLKSGELYNLETDIGEATDVAAAHSHVVRDLKKFASETENDLGTSSFGDGCRQMGRVTDPQPLLKPK